MQGASIAVYVLLLERPASSYIISENFNNSHQSVYARISNPSFTVSSIFYPTPWNEFIRRKSSIYQVGLSHNKWITGRREQQLQFFITLLAGNKTQNLISFMGLLFIFFQMIDYHRFAQRGMVLFSSSDEGSSYSRRTSPCGAIGWTSPCGAIG